VRYLGIEVDDALKLAEQTEIWMVLPKAVIFGGSSMGGPSGYKSEGPDLMSA